MSLSIPKSYRQRVPSESGILKIRKTPRLKNQKFDLDELDFLKSLVIRKKLEADPEDSFIFRVSDSILEKIKNNISALNQPELPKIPRKRKINSAEELEAEKERVLLQNQLNKEIAEKARDKNKGDFEI